MNSFANGAAGAAFKNLAECKRWLAALPLTNSLYAQAEITSQLKQLEQCEIPAMERLRIAEHLRETVDFLQGQSARKYLNKPLPPGSAETAAWQNVVDLWQALGSAYQRSLQAALSGDPEAEEWTPLIAHRCLRYTGFHILEQFRTYRTVEADLWRQLHSLYRIAEHRGFAVQPVKDSLNRQLDASTCQAAYVHILLLAAANPYHLSARYLNVLDKWLDKWAARVPLMTERPALADLSLHAINVDSTSGPCTLGADTTEGNWRYLNTSRLAEGVRKRIKFLRKGGSPADLDIGEECAQPGCESFLTELYQRWCEPPSGRSTTRRAGAQHAEVTFGMHGAHFCCNGMKPFAQPVKGMDYSREALQDLQMFGHVREREANLTPQQAGISLLEWDILDESALGFRLSRPGLEGLQIVFNQLLALRPKDASGFVLAGVKWLHFEPGGSVQLGVHTLPGAAIPVAARLVKLQAGEADFEPAFALPAIPALRLPATLVVPRGWFKPRIGVEIQDEALRTVTLVDILERGSDFERVTYSA